MLQIQRPAHLRRFIVPPHGSGGFLSSSSSLARSSAQVSRSHLSLDSRLSQRGFLIKPTVNQSRRHAKVRAQLLQVAAPGLSSNPQPSGVPPRGTKHQEDLVIPSSPPLGHGVSRYDIRVVQSPSDCILRSVSPLCRLRSDVSGPPSLTPCVSVVARQTPPRPCLCQWVRMAEGRPTLCHSDPLTQAGPGGSLSRYHTDTRSQGGRPRHIRPQAAKRRHRSQNAI